MKRPKPANRRTLLAIIVGGMLFAAFQVFYLINNGPHPQNVSTAISYKETPAKQPKKTAPQKPVRLKIPSLKVEATIEPMGLTQEGDMQSPNKVKNAGWYKFGVRPGNEGSAVIAGHYGPSIHGEIGVFDKLHTINKGDVIYVEDEKGGTTTFVVHSSQTYDLNDIVPDIFASSDGKAHLNLITCTGVWNKAQKTYSQRLVVFADKV